MDIWLWVEYAINSYCSHMTASVRHCLLIVWCVVFCSSNPILEEREKEMDHRFIGHLRRSPHLVDVLVCMYVSLQIVV